MEFWIKVVVNGSSNESSFLANHFSQGEAIDMEDRYITVGQFSVIGTIGIVINILPALITALGYVKRNVVNFMIANLSITEFALCTSFVFGQSFFVLWREYLPAVGCHFLSFFHFVAAFGSFMFLPILAINRYIHLYYKERYNAIYTTRNTTLMIVSCWIFCTIIPSFFMFMGKTGFDTDNNHCCMVVQGDVAWTIAYWLCIIVPLVVFCDGTMIFCNYKIYVKLVKHSSDVQMVQSVVAKNKELLYFLLVDMVFPICFHSVYHICKFALVHRSSAFLRRFFISLYLINSALRGAVTIGMLRPYRRGLQVLLYRLACRKQVTVMPALTEVSKTGATMGRARKFVTGST